MDKPYSPACERNAEPILAVLRERLMDRRTVLEIGSGTGQHAVHFAAALPHLRWQTADVDAHLPGIRMWLDEAALANTPVPITLDVNDDAWPRVARDAIGDAGGGGYDALFTANTLHIMGWAEVQRLFDALPGVMQPGALLIVYGPFNDEGKFSSPSNEAFDATLRAMNPKRGIRDLQAVDALARGAGMSLLEDRAMPANNRCVVWQRGVAA